jgi:hypothetical protein
MIKNLLPVAPGSSARKLALGLLLVVTGVLFVPRFSPFGHDERPAPVEWWIHPGFAVPFVTPGPGHDFKLVAFTEDTAEVDLKAYLGSIDHIHRTYSNGWPSGHETIEDERRDMAGEVAMFEQRVAFDYSVQTYDLSRERGSLYIRDARGYSRKYLVVVSMWTTEEDWKLGFQDELLTWTKQWLGSAWPFPADKIYFKCPVDMQKTHPDCGGAHGSL